MYHIQILEIAWPPDRQVCLRSVALPVVLGIGFRVDDANIPGSVYQEVQKIDALRLPQVLDAIADNDKIEPDPWCGDEIQCISDNYFVIALSQLEPFDIRLIDLNRREVALESIPLRRFSDYPA